MRDVLMWGGGELWLGCQGEQSMGHWTCFKPTGPVETRARAEPTHLVQARREPSRSTASWT